MYRLACGGKSAADCTSVSLDDINGMSHFGDIPDCFEGLPSKLYPLVITFQKFLMMLDGTVGTSFFNRFPEARDHSNGRTRRTTASITLATFIRMKEVNFDKFNLSCWPHFNEKFTKNLKPSTVFTGIMSHIKGGLKALDFHDGKLSREEYILLSERQVSNLSEQERENIYDIFLQYEKKKKVNGDYDLADLVADLHRRLRDENYEAINFDFVYIDEVQDLSMGQIALFKYVCRNVNNGFVFSGDTAQTIGKGVDFRFKDIRHLFYQEFIMKSISDRIHGGGKKGLITDLFITFERELLNPFRYFEVSSEFYQPCVLFLSSLCRCLEPRDKRYNWGNSSFG